MPRTASTPRTLTCRRHGSAPMAVARRRLNRLLGARERQTGQRYAYWNDKPITTATRAVWRDLWSGSECEVQPGSGATVRSAAFFGRVVGYRLCAAARCWHDTAGGHTLTAEVGRHGVDPDAGEPDVA